MKIKSPIITLLVGVLIAVVVAILSANAATSGKHYSEAVAVR
jgi:hypothetical protein